MLDAGHACLLFSAMRAFFSRPCVPSFSRVSEHMVGCDWVGGGAGRPQNMKKSWHTSTFHNLERVWKAEQVAIEEQKKAEQLRKELAEERQMEEMRKMQEAGGHIKCVRMNDRPLIRRHADMHLGERIVARGRRRVERVDWMYSGHSAGSAQLQEEYLLGKRRVDEKTTEVCVHCSHGPAQGREKGLVGGSKAGCPPLSPPLLTPLPPR